MARLKEQLLNPFTRSTWNVMLVQSAFVLLAILVFGFAIWHQQRLTQDAINERRSEIAAGMKSDPATLDTQLRDTRDSTLYIALFVLLVLALVFGYLTARYALRPTRDSLAAQKRFIGNIAHELRTPLAIIRTNTEVALMDRALSDYARSTMQTTIEELDRISGIINNLLSIDSLVRPGNIKVEPLLLRDIANAVV
ncbi:MAG TPA: histidine kinase dimerization/phospho-acceptor domain-containing protein, partial [Candidatus Paceibacterota bacterium]|nr:histidine kinase dimerization/phospho-acceptor domain-containing protein [Candidatus Paceibacterota bacterium]